VISKWGKYGFYQHALENSPPIYGHKTLILRKLI
jgi:hypothetical protein